MQRSTRFKYECSALLMGEGKTDQWIGSEWAGPSGQDTAIDKERRHLDLEWGHSPGMISSQDARLTMGTVGMTATAGRPPRP